MTDSTTVSPTSKLLLCNPAEASAARVPTLTLGRLTGWVCDVAALMPGEREQMYALLEAYFVNVTRTQFEQDLSEKEWVLLVADTSTGHLQGFSTLMLLQTVVTGRPVVAFFSGDTVVDRAYWGETLLSRLWALHVFGLADRIRRNQPETQVYWFLISSGYKTYRFLSTFFREFYPVYDRPLPLAIRQTRDALALLKFGMAYQPERGVVRLPGATPLRQGVADITEQQLSDPHVAFFVAANPGHVDGDELACLAEIGPANLTPAGRRMLGLSRIGS